MFRNVDWILISNWRFSHPQKFHSAVASLKMSFEETHTREKNVRKKVIKRIFFRKWRIKYRWSGALFKKILGKYSKSKHQPEITFHFNFFLLEIAATSSLLPVQRVRKSVKISYREIVVFRSRKGLIAMNCK